MRRTGGNIIIHRRLLIIPRDPHARPFRDIQRKLRPQHPRRAGGCRLTRLLIRRPLLRDDEFEDEIVGDFQPVGGVDGALRTRGGVDGAGEFAFDGAVGEVGFPALLEFVHADVAGGFVLKAFAFAADFGAVESAGGGDGDFVFFDAPGEFTETPAGLRVVAFRGDARHAAGDGEVADGVDDVGEGDVQGEVGRGKDADGVFVVAWAEGAEDGQGAAELDFFARGGAGADVQGVFDGGEGAVGGGGEVARDEVGEGQFLDAVLRREEFGFGEEVPFVEVFDLGGAFAAAVGDGAFGGGGALEVHGDGLEDGVVAERGDAQTTGDQCAGGGGGAVDHEDRRGFHVKVHFDALRAEGRAGGFLVLGLGLFVFRDGAVFAVARGVFLGQAEGGAFEVHGVVVAAAVAAGGTRAADFEGG